MEPRRSIRKMFPDSSRILDVELDVSVVVIEGQVYVNDLNLTQLP